MAGNQNTQYNWRDEVERIDGESRHIESLYPIVYIFSSGAKRRDSGPASGVYEGS